MCLWKCLKNQSPHPPTDDAPIKYSYHMPCPRIITSRLVANINIHLGLLVHYSYIISLSIYLWVDWISSESSLKGRWCGYDGGDTSSSAVLHDTHSAMLSRKNPELPPPTLLSPFLWQNIHFVLTRYNKTSIRDISRGDSEKFASPVHVPCIYL